MRPTVSRLGLILFFSGFCSLVYQVAWLRLLRLIFGSSTASTAVVLAIFMGGLGLGGLVLGRRAERSPNPLRFYAFLELGIALSAALSPLLIDAVRGLYIALGGAEGLGLFGATALRLLLATIVLGVPTTLMGGTLPAVAQAMERDKDEGRRLVALFYGVNTFGAVTGAFLTTFILLELLGVRQSLWLSAALNLLLAMVVRAMAARTMADPHPLTPSPRKRGETGEEGSPTNLERVPGGEGSTASRLVLFGAFFVGFVFFLMEIVWYRMLAPILGGSSYTFGLILAVALFGIAVGGGLYSLGSEGRRPSLEALAWTAVLEAFALIVPYALGDHLALFTAIVRRLGAEGFTGMVLGWTIVTVIVILPAAVIAGYQFPLLVGLLGSGREKVGSQVGLAYAWNTFGAILGSLAGGFGLLPLLGALRLWLLSTLGLVLLGVAMAWTALGTRRPARLLAPILAGALALALGLADGPTAFWRHVPIGAGRLDVGFDGPNDVRHKMHQERRSLVLEEEGIESSVALMRRNELALYVNGKSDGSVRTDAPTMVWSGLVGALLHPDPKNVLAIGLGSGTTAGWLAAVPGVERVDVVELEPTVIELARYFEPVNAFVMDRDNVRVWAGDGREHVLTTSERYDLVMSQPSNPYRAGVADLFSQDFYASLAERLAPGGIFMQWLQGYEVDPSVVRTAYATLGSVFPHVESWQINATDLLLLATREPLVHDLDRIRRRIGGEPYARALDVTWRVGGIEGLYSGFIGNDRLTRVLAEGVEDERDLETLRAIGVHAASE